MFWQEASVIATAIINEQSTEDKPLGMVTGKRKQKKKKNPVVVLGDEGEVDVEDGSVFAVLGRSADDADEDDGQEWEQVKKH